MNAEMPPTFPRDLLQRSARARQHYFERHVTIDHPRLLEVVKRVVAAVCFPEGESVRVADKSGETTTVGTTQRPSMVQNDADRLLLERLETESQTHREPKMALFIGPSRVGKTTSIQYIERDLLRRAQADMATDKDYVPFVVINAQGEPTGRFDWIKYAQSALKALGDPFIDFTQRNHRVLRGRDYESAMIEALLQHKTSVIIVDEAQNLGQARTGRGLEDHLKFLKSIEQSAGVSHVFVGTYEMRPFRTVNEQVSLRTTDVHFSRYDVAIDEDRNDFVSTLWALQYSLPMPEVPPLIDYWEYLYERSLGCIGILKAHLNGALAIALEEGANTITETHLKLAQMPADKLIRALNTIRTGESELRDTRAKDAELAQLLGTVSIASSPTVSPQDQDDETFETGIDSMSSVEKQAEAPPGRSGSKKSTGSRRGTRRPGRDMVGDPIVHERETHRAG